MNELKFLYQGLPKLEPN